MYLRTDPKKVRPREEARRIVALSLTSIKSKRFFENDRVAV